MLSYHSETDTRSEESFSLRIHPEWITTNELLERDGFKRFVHVEITWTRALRVVADAYSANACFVKPLIEEGIGVISRKDAVGRDNPPEYSGGGRPRTKGKKWKQADLIN